MSINFLDNGNGNRLLEAIANTARHDGVDIPIILEEEPGSGGKNQVAAVKDYIKTFPELEIS